MSDTVKKNLGIVTAYGYARSKGYEGTEEEFAELMASYAEVAEDAAQSASEAAQSATNAAGSATAASGSAVSAANSATSASGSAQDAETAQAAAQQSATVAAGSATSASGSATAASGSAAQAAQSATSAAGSATSAQSYSSTAASAAQAASGSADDADTSATAAAASAAAAAESARTLTIDNTLTQQGQAADSKKTGDEISAIKVDLTQVEKSQRLVPTESVGVDLDIADEDGYVLVRFKDGHIETKNFDSRNVSSDSMSKFPRFSGTTSENIDLDITDRQGYVLLRLDDGHIATKNFDSRTIAGMIEASPSDIGKILKVKSVNDNKVLEWEYAEASGIADDIILNIPEKVYATQGIEYNIYFENICENWSKYLWDVNCTKGMQLERGYRITPVAADAGEYPITIKVTRIDDPSIYKEVTSTLIISAESAGTGETVSVIVLGDSTTDYGVAVTKLHSDIDGTGMTLETLGTRGTSPNNHEGRSGWSFQYYCTKASDASDQSIVNPFYNPTTNTFDASYYFSNSGISTPDWFIINLGINDVFGASNDTEAETAINTALGYADEMIESILSATQDTKIGLCLTIPPNHSQDAFGKGYKCGQTRNRYKRNNTLLVNRIMFEYGDRESERIYLVPINTALDTVYNMTLETIPVNARNTDITYQSPVGNAGVHPNAFGLWQVADVYAALIKGNI